MPTPAAGALPEPREGAEGLRVDETRRDGVVFLTLRGELDIRTSPHLRGRLADIVRRGEEDVVIDMCAVGFVDSTGLAVLLNALRRLTRAERRLVLVCPDGAVLRMLRLTRLDSTFTVRSTHADALAALRGA